jgi:2-keto-myo-inositol isomerase
MKLGFHGATTMTADLETDVAATAHAGFKALELWAAKVDRFLADHSREELNALLKGADVSPMTLNSIEFISFRSDAEYAQILERCHELCDIAQFIGCPTVIVVPSPTPDREMSWGDIVDEHVRVLRELGDIAGKYGIGLAFEFLGFGWCSVRTPRGAWEIVQRTDRDNVGLVMDAAHFYGGGGLLSELDCIDPAHIFAFHLDDLEDVPKEDISDAKRLLPGLGVIPLADICARLKGIGYDNVCSIELFRPEYWEWDPKEVAVKAKEAAVKVLSPYFQVV